MKFHGSFYNRTIWLYKIPMCIEGIQIWNNVVYVFSYIIVVCICINSSYVLNLNVFHLFMYVFYLICHFFGKIVPCQFTQIHIIIIFYLKGVITISRIILGVYNHPLMLNYRKANSLRGMWKHTDKQTYTHTYYDINWFTCF